MRLGAFAIVAEERGFSESCSRALKLITERRFFCGRGLLLSGRVIHLDGDSLILEPHSSGHRVPLPFCAYGSGLCRNALGAGGICILGSVREWGASLSQV